MPQAGMPARARRRQAAPWWEELDREAFRFPTAYDVKPAQRPVARMTNGNVRAAAPATNGRAPATDERAPAADRRRPATDGRTPAANGRASARVAGPSSPPRPVAAASAPSAAAPTPAPAPSGAPVTPRAADGGRRTVTIRGYGAERNLPVARPTLRRHERPGFRPDRAALWAVFLGLVLILVAVASAHG
jgi:hypothetical protein